MSDRNRTLRLTEEEINILQAKLHEARKNLSLEEVKNKIFLQDVLELSKFLPNNFVDLLFLDPPYNLSKTFNNNSFQKKAVSEYTEILDNWIKSILHTLKPDATIYICGDWHSSYSIYEVAEKYFKVRNRITWEREKGRGANSNWKNCSEDIWFCTMSNDYYFNADAVKLKKKVIAPYRNDDGSSRDWEKSEEGNFRLTSPSNLWTDITIPFWSMPENTDHPTQKPEKLLAKLILASSKKDAVIFDPFLGSGSTAVVAKKLGRNFLGVELEKKYACYAIKRLEMASFNNDIQGYSEGVFWERNSLSAQKKSPQKNGVSNISYKSLDFLEAIA